MSTSLCVPQPVSWMIAMAAVGGALCLGAGARAQTGSAPVGVMSYAVAENSTISLGVPLLRPAVTSGVVGAVNGAALSFAGSEAAVAVPLAADVSYYLEVVAPVDGTATALIGQRFEVDEAATRAAAVGNLIVDTTSPHNTGAASALAGLANHRVAVRPHWTLADLLGTGTATRLNAAVAAAAADQVLAWDGKAFSVYFLRSGAVPQWRNVATGAANQDGAILPPGMGLFLRRQVGALSFTVTGEVRTNRFVLPAFAGSQLVANGFPVALSPADWNLTGGTGATAGTTPLDSDRVLAWLGDSFETYFLANGVTPQWRTTTTALLDHSKAPLFPAQGANLLLLRAATSGNPPPPLAQAVPFSL